MKKQMLITLVVAAFMLMPLSTAFSSEVFKTTTEMIQWDPDRAYNGYSLFCSFGNDPILIDMEGNVVNIWDRGDVGPVYSYLMENGNLRVHGTYPDNPDGDLTPENPQQGLLQFGGVTGRIQERDWNNNIIFDLAAYDGTDIDDDGVLEYGTFRAHHDFQRIWNNDLQQYTWMVMVWHVKGPDDAVGMGVDDAYIGRSENGYSPDALMEFTYDGELVWQWCFNDHMVTADPSGTGTVDTDGWQDIYGRENAGVTLLAPGEDFSDHYGKLNVNGIHYTELSGPRPDYQHCNSFDYDEGTGYISINAKAPSEFFVIDHDGTFMLDSAADLTGTATTGAAIISVGNTRGADARSSAGDFLYRFGNPSNYDSGEAPGYYNQGDQQMFGTHDIQWIQDYHWRPDYSGQGLWPDPTASVALPGAGDFLLFDNACYDPRLQGSVILQLDPYETGGTGTPDPISGYVDPATAGYDGQDSNQVTWRFGGSGGFGGPSPINDFYSSYISGTTRLPNGNTIICSGAMGHFFEVTEGGDVVWEYVNPQMGSFNQPATIQASMNQGEGNRTFRFHRFGPDYPGLSGKDLTTRGTLTGRLPGSVDQYPEPAPAPTGWGTSGLAAGEGGGGSAGGSGSGSGGVY